MYIAKLFQAIINRNLLIHKGYRGVVLKLATPAAAPADREYIIPHIIFSLILTHFIPDLYYKCILFQLLNIPIIGVIKSKSILFFICTIFSKSRYQSRSIPLPLRVTAILKLLKNLNFSIFKLYILYTSRVWTTFTKFQINKVTKQL